ncbi:uncharacterized protein G2W53_028836 [Senna tora]|uniref:Uncharacterized protein n=1 Tax=Senna tora TaxID=362788 RepID=A0A834WA51_9FABA|nr:uncharacterized protein G2W53_028836 [Senna tora]
MEKFTETPNIRLQLLLKKQRSTNRKTKARQKQQEEPRKLPLSGNKERNIAVAAFGVLVRTEPSGEPGITPSPGAAPTVTPPRSLSATTPWRARLCGGSALSRASPSNRWRTHSPETSSLSATTPWRARLCGGFAISRASPSDRWRTRSPKTSTTGLAVSREERSTTTFTFGAPRW